MEDEPRTLIVSEIDSNLDESRIDLVNLGQSDKVKLVASNDVKRVTPGTTLPLGLPPVYPELKDEIERLLLIPEDIPIHAFQHSQKVWEQEKDLENLFDIGLSPPTTELVMERDPKTGKLHSIKEELNLELGYTAQNSMLMTRQPGAYNESVRGDSSNCPFWPGGMKLPSLEKMLKEDIDVEIIDISPKTLLKKAPGLPMGVEFDQSRKATRTEGVETPDLFDTKAVSITDIMNMDVDLSELYVDVDKDVTESCSQESPVDMVYSVKEEIPENVLKVEEIDEKKVAEKAKEKKWSILDQSDVSDFHKRVPDMAFKYPFELDSFQKRAVVHLERHENVLVAAHTSAGKTVVAEYAIALAQKHMRRAIYTSPIKALSNQKFRDFKGTFPEVGLLTGDVQIKPESSCLIMTTEILRSMLYNGSDVIRDVEWVIFDEIHYINDADRGVVWEEVLIMLPAHVGIILLSATVPNTIEFAAWIGKTKQKEVYVVQTKKRPVPLEHYCYTGNSNKTSNELFCILDQKGKFLIEGYRAAVQAKKNRASKSDESYGPKGTRQGNPKQDRNVWLSVVQMLKKKEQLPVVAFTLSKKKCDSNADMVRNSDLVTMTEQSHITTFFNRSMSKLKGNDRDLPQVKWMEELLKCGIGVHHSGILPILKEVVEMLFQKGLIKILFATETFAMGVNMPARTVVFDSTRKFDGEKMRDLLSSEYIQMAGRAGRRGLDSTGMVIILCKGDVPETSVFHTMMLGMPTKLESRFRLTYYMILNLLRVKQLTVEDMMKRSFAEYYQQKDAPENERKLEELQGQVALLKEPDCQVCSVDLKQYYMNWAELLQRKKDLKSKILSSKFAQKLLTPGRVVLVTNRHHQNALGIILKQGTLDSKYNSNSTPKDVLDNIYIVLLICDKWYELSIMNNTAVKNNTSPPTSELHSDLFLSKKIFVPTDESGQAVEEIPSVCIEEILDRSLTVDATKIIENFKKRLIPRFRDDPPSQSTVLAAQDLLNLAYDYQSVTCPTFDPIKDMKINDIDFVDQSKRVDFLEKKLTTYQCLQCQNIHEHFSVMRANMQVRNDVSMLQLQLSDQNLQLIKEYEQRIMVLQRLDYIDKDKALRHKGRVAFEISNHEVMITELLINNILTDLHPAEIVAILSLFVFEQRHTSKPTLTENLQKIYDQVKETAIKVAECQRACGLDTTIEEYVEGLHIGLVEVVYEWARGMSFKDVMNLTDVSEGNIVRCIQRLDELCRDVRKASHVIGVQILCDKMEEGMSLIRRDIVFTASLYLSTN